MHLLDMRTAIVGLSVSSAFFVLVTAYLRHHYSSRFAGLGHWLSCSLLIAAASSLLALRGSVPDFCSVLLANIMLVGGTIILIVGLERFLGKPGPFSRYVVLLALFSLAHAYFLYVDPSFHARVINISLALLILNAQGFWILARRIDPPQRPMARFMAAIYAGFTFLHFARLVHQVFVTADQDFLRSGMFKVALFILADTLVMAAAFGLVLLVAGRLGDELQERIGDLKLETQARAENAEMFSRAFHGGPLMMTISEIETGMLLEVNENFTLATGYAREEAIGAGTIDLGLISAEDRARLTRELRAKGRVSGLELVSKMKNGGIARCLYFGEVITVAGRPKLLTLVEDITARRQAEEALRERIQELSELKGSLERRVSERTTELRESQRQLQALSVRLAETEELDRRMMSDFLRDEIGTLIAICRLSLEPAPGGGENAVRDAAAARDLLAQAMSSTRDLTAALCSQTLYGIGLVAAIEDLCEKTRELHGLECVVEATGDLALLSPVLRRLIYRAVRELVTNVVDHAAARRAIVTIGLADGSVRVRVQDDGRGAAATADIFSPRETGGYGLFSIRELVHYFGGEMRLDSPAAAGCVVEFSLPCRELQPA